VDDTVVGVPAGTTFNVPSQIIAVQALIIIATVTTFFAAIAGCADAGMDSGSKPVAAGAVLCSLIAFVFCLAAYCLWTVIPYVTSIQAGVPSVWMPVWTNQGANEMTVIQVYDTWLGPGWATALTASILTFFAMIIHCFSLRDSNEMDLEDTRPNFTVPPPTQPVQKDGSMAGPIPASAVNPVYNQATPATAVPAAAVPPAASGNNMANTDLYNV
jgi:hypothetical protein